LRRTRSRRTTIGKEIPISEAKNLAVKYHYQQVIVFACDRENAQNWVTTWGETRAFCDEAGRVGAIIGNLFGDQSIETLRQLRERLDAELERRTAANV
jgi:hypothetical protein